MRSPHTSLRIPPWHASPLQDQGNEARIPPEPITNPSQRQPLAVELDDLLDLVISQRLMPKLNTLGSQQSQYGAFADAVGLYESGGRLTGLVVGNQLGQYLRAETFAGLVLSRPLRTAVGKILGNLNVR